MIVPSQVDDQSIKGLPPVQVRPNTGQPALTTNSVVGQTTPIHNQNKGKGNN